MSATHQRDFLQRLRAPCFIELNTDWQTQVLHLHTASTFTTAPTTTQKEATTPLAHPMDLQREETGCYRNLHTNLIQTDIPVYQNFVRIPAAVFDLIEE